MSNIEQLAAQVRAVMACGRLTKRYRDNLADIAAELDELADGGLTDELEAMAISLHEQAHGLVPIRHCAKAPCAENGHLVLTIGPSPWAYS